MDHPTLIRLAKNREQLLALVRDLPDEAFDWCLDQDWSIRQILTHLVNAEEDHRQVIEAIVTDQAGRIPSHVELDAHNAARLAERGHLARRDLLAALDEQRAQTVALFARLSADELDRTGTHPVLGDMSAGSIFRILAMHDHGHTRDIRAILSRAGE